MCSNKCCLDKGERHLEDLCPFGGSFTPVKTAVAPKTVVKTAAAAAVAPRTAATQVPATATPPQTVPVAKSKGRAVRLQNHFQMFDDEDDDCEAGKSDVDSVS